MGSGTNSLRSTALNPSPVLRSPWYSHDTRSPSITCEGYTKSPKDGQGLRSVNPKVYLRPLGTSKWTL